MSQRTRPRATEKIVRFVSFGDDARDKTLTEGNYPVDADLFYVLATVLLLAILLALLAGLSTLNSIKNGLAEGAARDFSSGTSSLGPVAESAYDLPATSATQTGSAYTASAEVSSYAQPEPAATTSYSQPEEVSTGFVSMAEVEPQIAQATGGAVTLRGDEPEEQPFEREGRWWFKRGGELLVYEEGTGQWVPADAGGAASTSTTTAAFPTTGSGAVTQTDTGEGWKCSSCGAVNGSTATSCRMCFTPR